MGASYSSYITKTPNLEVQNNYFIVFTDPVGRDLDRAQ